MSTIINATTTNGVVIQPDNSGSLVLQTNSGTTALTIDTSQNATFAAQATIPTINLTGGQITFPATAVPSANANTLDDYEEGTFDPAPAPSVGSFTTASGTGTYVKIGKQVTISVSITITNVGSGSGVINYAPPFSVSVFSVGAAAETNSVGITGVTYLSTTLGVIRKYDWTGVVIGNNYIWRATATYFI
jgi:hypothetical protein